MKHPKPSKLLSRKKGPHPALLMWVQLKCSLAQFQTKHNNLKRVVDDSQRRPDPKWVHLKKDQHLFHKFHRIRYSTPTLRNSGPLWQVMNCYLHGGSVALDEHCMNRAYPSRVFAPTRHNFWDPLALLNFFFRFYVIIFFYHSNMIYMFQFIFSSYIYHYNWCST